MKRTRYIIHNKCGTLELLRGAEISIRISRKYPLSSQIAVLFDRDIKPEKYAAYQAYRQACKNEVDLEFQRIKESL